MPLSHFKFYNDIGEWFFMDKMGHVFSTFLLSDLHFNLYNKLCAESPHTLPPEMKAFFLANATMLIMEILDGFGKSWGFSIPDVISNTLGGVLWLFSKNLSHSIIINPAFSYNDSKEWRLRPQVLGNSLPLRIFKNYNGQTYWLKIGKRGWLPAIAIGYSVKNVTGAISNPLPYNNLNRTFEVFISPDISYEEIKTSSVLVKKIFNVFKYIKTPLPALEITRNTGQKIVLSFRILYF